VGDPAFARDSLELDGRQGQLLTEVAQELHDLVG
jgi:hypothetical protein